MDQEAKYWVEGDVNLLPPPIPPTLGNLSRKGNDLCFYCLLHRAPSPQRPWRQAVTGGKVAGRSAPMEYTAREGGGQNLCTYDPGLSLTLEDTPISGREVVCSLFCTS